MEILLISFKVSLKEKFDFEIDKSISEDVCHFELGSKCEHAGSTFGTIYLEGT